MLYYCGGVMKIKSVTIKNFRSIQNETIFLDNYTALIGPNNVGKSNILAALLFFYDSITLKNTDFLCGPKCMSDNLYVDVEFIDLSSELFESLPDQYKLPDKRLKVRRMAHKGGKSIYKGFTYEDGIEGLYDSDFFGAKGVGKGKIGNVVYVPALKNVNDELKTTGSATLAKLLKEVVQPGITDSPEYEDFSNAVTNLSEKFRGEPIDNFVDWDGRSLGGVECFLNEELKPWNCKVKVNLEPLDPAKLAQQSTAMTIEEGGHLPLPVDSKGQGLQRSLEVALVKLWAEVTRRKDKQGAKPDKKNFHPEFSLLLIEEPETFQHPQQQYKFYADLSEIGDAPNYQVIATTHSPYFLTPHINDLTSIIRVSKDSNDTYAKMISKEFIDELADKEDGTFRYHLWLNQARNEMFFSDAVILVEGVTEKALFNWLLQNGEGITSRQRHKCYVMDCGGKFNIDKFMGLLTEFEIPHLVVHDKDDENKEFHKVANNNIQTCRNKFTYEVMILDPDLERYLGLDLPDRQSEKPPAILDYLNDEAKRNNQKLQKFCDLITKNIAAAES